MTPFGYCWFSVRLVLAGGDLFIGKRVAQPTAQRQQPIAKRLGAAIHRDVSLPENLLPILIILRFASQSESVGALRRGDIGHE